MAFRKRFTKRRSFRRRGQPLARKRVNWFNSYDNNLCSDLDLFPPCDDPEVDGTFSCCTPLALLTLVNNSTLEQDYSDRARVVRMIGQLWLGLDFTNSINDFATLIFAHGPPFTTVETAQATNTYLSFLNAYMRVGLWKTAIGHDDAGQAIFVGLNPMTDYTYTEGQWKHVWEHAWVPQRTDGFGQTGPGFFVPSGCCSVVTGEYSAPDILDGTTVPLTETSLDIQTECQPCAGTAPADAQLTGVGFQFKYPAAWHLAWDRKFKIPLRENEQLMLSIGWRATPNSTSIQGVLRQPTLQMFGGIRTLLQF